MVQARLLEDTRNRYAYIPLYYWDMWDEWECMYWNGFLTETEYNIGPFAE